MMNGVFVIRLSFCEWQRNNSTTVLQIIVIQSQGSIIEAHDHNRHHRPNNSMNATKQTFSDSPT
jgi:hypothetical protein